MALGSLLGSRRSKSRSPRGRKPALSCGAPEGIRTPNLLIRSQMLYPLSYGRVLVNLYLDPTRSDRGRPSGVSGGSGI